DWSSDVCSSDLASAEHVGNVPHNGPGVRAATMSWQLHLFGRSTSASRYTQRALLALPHDGEEEVSMSKYLASLLIAVPLVLSSTLVQGGSKKEPQQKVVKN